MGCAPRATDARQSQISRPNASLDWGPHWEPGDGATPTAEANRKTPQAKCASRARRSYWHNDLAFTRGRRTPSTRTAAAQPRRPSGATLCYAHAPITPRPSSCRRWHQKVYAHPGKRAMPKSAPRRAGAARRHQGGATSSTGRAATWGRNRSTAHADQVSSQSLFRNHRPSVANARAAPWGAQTEPQPPVGARSADQTRLQFGGRTASQVTVPRRPPRQHDKLHTRTIHLVHDGRIGITT